MRIITRITPSSVFRYAEVPDEVSSITYSPKENAVAFCCFSTGDVGFASASDVRYVKRRREVPNPMGMCCDGKGILVFQLSQGLVWMFDHSMVGKGALCGRKAYLDFEMCVSFGDREASVPVGMDRIGDGIVAVAVPSSNRVIAMTARSSHVIAGNGRKGFSISGDPATSLLNSPSGLCLDRDGGELFVTDTGNGVLRGILPSGTCRIIGKPGDLRQADGPLDKVRFARPTVIRANKGSIAVVDGGSVRTIDLNSGKSSTAYITSRRIIDMTYCDAGVFVLEEKR